MVAEMSYTTVSLIIDSWESIRRMKNYEEVAGVMLYKKFFALEPTAKDVFSFGHVELTDDFYKSPRLLKHAKYFIQMVDRSLSLLGPDIELLTEIMEDLGKKHARFGVTPSMFPPMGTALISTVKELLGDKWTPELNTAWLEVYQAFSYDMMRSNKAQ